MPRHDHDEVLLITGYPSFGARQLAALALRTRPGCFVYALVESSQLETAQEHIAALPPSSRQRFQLLEGSVTHIDLGLSGAEAKQLCAEIDCIHHMAQLSRPGMSRESAERVNIRGTLEMIEFARGCRHLRAFIHHSTAFVAGDRTGVVREESIEGQPLYRNHFETTKAIAEQFVRAAQHALPIMILRPTLIVGDSQSGEIDQLDGPYFPLLLMLSTPSELAVPVPHSENPLHLVPVDYVVQAALTLGRDPRAIGKTFHLADPHSLPANRVFQLLAQAVGRRAGGPLPAALTRALLNAPGMERFAWNPRSFLEQILTPVKFDTTHTEQLLAGTSITCPPFDTYVDQLVAYVRARFLVETPPDNGRPSLEIDMDDLP